MLIVGRVGYGKSALINTLFEDCVAEENDCASSVTQTVTCHKCVRYDVNVTIADTPGFFDNEKGKGTPEIFAEIGRAMREVDLILFCIKMTERFSSNEEDLIEIVTRAYGTNVWKNAIFALTFANKVEVPRRSSIDLETHFSNKLEDIKRLTFEAVEKFAHLSKDVALKIPVLPVGSDDRILPNTHDWFTPFWYTCFKQINNRAKPAFLKIGVHQMLSRLSEADANLDAIIPDLSEIELIMSESDNHETAADHGYWHSILKKIIEFIKTIRFYSKIN